MRLFDARPLLPLLLLASAAWAAEGNDPYVKLFRAQEAMAAKGDPLAEYYLGEMHESGLGTEPDLEQALNLYRRSAAKGNALARRKLEEIAREQEEAEREKRHARAEADARARRKAEAEAVRLAKEQEQARRFQQERAKEGDAFW
jgi:TPR repeat protein